MIVILVHLNYHELDHPVNVRDHFHEISPLLPIKYSPFQQDGMGNSGYLYPCNEELAIKLLEMISELNIYLTSEEQLEFAIDAIKVTEHNTLIPLIAETELEVKTKIRLGQQYFRKKSAAAMGRKMCIMWHRFTGFTNCKSFKTLEG